MTAPPPPSTTTTATSARALATSVGRAVLVVVMVAVALVAAVVAPPRRTTDAQVASPRLEGRPGMATPAQGFRPPAPAGPPPPLTVGCDRLACSGVINGSRYRVELPKNWNGTLLLYFHGFRPGIGFDNGRPDMSVAAAPSRQVADDLLDMGYALGGTSYRSQGWAVVDAEQSQVDLYHWFTEHVATPQYTVVWGESFGGLVTTLLAESGREWISGASPLCAPLAGLPRRMDQALDTAYVIRELLAPNLPLAGYHSSLDASRALTRVKGVLGRPGQESPAQVAAILIAAEVAGGPHRTRRHPGDTRASRIAAAREVVEEGLTSNTLKRWDLERRVHGNPAGNTRADYGARLSAEFRDEVERLAPGQLGPALQKLNRGQRVEADPLARAGAATLGDPKGGNLSVPMVLLHNLDDPVVTYNHQGEYVAEVTAAGRISLLFPLTSVAPQGISPSPYGAGHCNFTAAEVTTTLTLVDRWARTGERPTAFTARAKAEEMSRLTGTPNGLEPERTAPPWPRDATPQPG